MSYRDRLRRGVMLMLGVGLIGLLAGRGSAQEQRDERAPTIAAIEAAQEQGEISEAQAVLYKLYFVKGSSRLPQVFSLGGDRQKCATGVMLEAREKMGTFPLALRTEVESFLQRPVDLPNTIDTAHYRIHYATTGPKTIWGWPNTAYRDSIMAACEKSWNFYHVLHTWRTPPSDGANGGGNGLIDCYVDDLGTSAYGYTESEDQVSGGPNWPNDYTAFFVIDNDYAGFGYSDRVVPMKVTVAHEYHHVVQMGYTTGNGWWMENVSTFNEDEVYDEINDNYQYLGCFTSQPYKKHSTANGCFEYGAFLWPTYIKENWGHNTIQDLQYCAATTNIFNCFDSVFAGHGSDYASALADWAVWNFYTFARDDGNHYVEGSDYHYYTAFDHEHTTYPVSNQHPGSTRMPEATGTSVQRFRRDTGSPDNKLTLTYDGPSCTKQVMMVVKDASGAVFHEYFMVLDANGNGTMDVPNWNQAEFGHMIVSLPRACGSGTFDYVYGATTTISVGVDTNPALYARTIQLDQNFPNPFGPATRIDYRLDQGGPVNLAVFDAGGRQVRALVRTVQGAGEYSVRWDGRDDDGRSVDSGVYFYRLSSGQESQVRKLIVAE
jgi:hypothetical protein